ncbi:MAG: T9SS type A sorting domain-containing protein, partial [Bacteroidales bacterium]|nr:T9SS type A sorting domain-containing protein [Bacteroidales bacterium]
FNDESQGNLATWFWDFGDGTTSPDQFPVHTYAAQGTYFVCLTVTSACSYCCDTWCDSVVIDASGYFNLGGTVYAGNFPIDEGFAYLYRVENGQIIDVFASFIHEYGYYDFFQLEEGTYILKAELSPNSPLYNLYIPTYYVSVPNWINASVINLQSNIWNADVHMIPISGASPGSGTIAGEIHKDGSGMPESFPVQHVEILLMDAQGQMLSCEYTDTHGSFIFPELAYGTYTVMAEVTGKYSSPAYVTIDEDHPSVTDILFIITGNEITLATGEGLSATGDWVGRIFPNPASDMVMIEIAPVRAENVSFVLVDQRGQTAMESIRDCGSGNQVVALDVSGLKAGLYTLVIRDDRGALSVRKVVKQ